MTHMNPGQKLGVMIAAAPESTNFKKGVERAAAELANGCSVYIYCIDEAVAGLAEPELQSAHERGAKLFACAYSMQERGLENHSGTTLAGLTILSDLIASTDHFESFT